MSSAYFRLVEHGLELAYVKPVVRCMIPLNIGMSVKAFAIPSDLRFELDRLTDDPVGNFYPDYYLMSPEMATTLQAAGVDNLELFPTEVVDKKTGQVHKYWTFNVVGSVACADVGQSESLPIGAAMHFEKLVIDSARARQLILFRLKESMSDIIVSASVAEMLTNANLFGVAIEPLSVSSS